MRILFICRWNRFRSKVAEVVFRKYAGNKAESKSAGIMTYTSPFMTKESIKILKEKGYEITDEKSRRVNKSLIEWADKIIIVADDVPKKIFPEEKTICWDIRDEEESDFERVRKTIDIIERKVKEFVGNKVLKKDIISI